ncbi:MAG: hypothetical protein JWQ73_676 [Variovorax sp.]|nr:hypothetical protein [Variovorax sp.]
MKVPRDGCKCDCEDGNKQGYIPAPSGHIPCALKLPEFCRKFFRRDAP